MEFFEFFFSGPNWGWKVFALILCMSPICNTITNIVESICKIFIKTNATTDEQSGSNPATKDDVRS